MNELKSTLSNNLEYMASMKQDLTEVASLLKEKPVDPNNIL